MIVDGVVFWRSSLVHAMMGDAVDAEDERLLEHPGRDVFAQLRVSRLYASARHHSATSCDAIELDTHFDTSFSANSSVNISTPPAHTTLALFFV